MLNSHPSAKVEKECITQPYLKELFVYNSEKGELVHKHRSREKFSTFRGYKIWNGRYKGKVAGSLSTQKKHGGYIRVGINNKHYMAHRLVWLYVYGKWPEGEVDHINHVRDDNRILNLRVVTRTENNRNQSFSKNNTSGITGVSWNKRREKWEANIGENGKNKSLGRYRSLFDAVCARKSEEARQKYHKNHGLIAA